MFPPQSKFKFWLCHCTNRSNYVSNIAAWLSCVVYVGGHITCCVKNIDRAKEPNSRIKVEPMQTLLSHRLNISLSLCSIGYGLN